MKRSLTLCFSLLAVILLLGSCAVSRVSEEPSFQPELFSSVIKGSCFDREGNQVEVASDYYLIYYAADWCPYCTEYAEELKQTYSQLKKMYGNVEIIFAGHVRDEGNEDLLSFMNQGEYPFPYIKYEFRERTNIMNLVDVPKFWIPGFVLLDKYGNVLSSSNGEDKDAYYLQKPINAYQTLQQSDCVSCQK
ncbi:MAG: redoxin domain-containing protein [Spirochaetia bacterium]|jgi:thiol-disulfide isomerase/thioredoxin|nr:redoxin domain-containing protein [Spirochaetia bacterium]